MPDREKVINGLRSIKTYLASQAFETEDSFAREGFIESQKDIDDAIDLLKEQEKEIENLKEIIKKADYTLEIAKDKLNDLLKKTEGR
jgi:hypothetical protein